jgi:hypothetical protein
VKQKAVPTLREIDRFFIAWNERAPYQRATFEWLRRDYYPPEWPERQVFADIIYDAPYLQQRRQRGKKMPPQVKLECDALARRWHGTVDTWKDRQKRMEVAARVQAAREPRAIDEAAQAQLAADAEARLADRYEVFPQRAPADVLDAAPAAPPEPMAAPNGDAPQLVSDRTGAPGRPSSKHLVEREFRRRIEACELETGVAAQSRVLHEWLVNKYPGLPPLKAGAIENFIRKDYWKARGKPTE